MILLNIKGGENLRDLYKATFFINGVYDYILVSSKTKLENLMALKNSNNMFVNFKESNDEEYIYTLILDLINEYRKNDYKNC